MSSVKVDKKITGFSIVKEGENLAKPASKESKVQCQQMSEKVKRPDVLHGITYKIKPPQAEHALYVTINDIILNEGTEHEVRRPFEIFLSSKNMEHFQWTVALTLIISAIFRKGGDITFLVEELRSVFDPNGGYLKRGGKYVPSLVSEIGDVIEQHLQLIGMLPCEEMDEAQKLYIAAKKEEINAKKSESSEENQFPPEAQVCSKCMTKALVRLDGCLTCLNCGYSKCG